MNFIRSPAVVSASTALFPTNECMCEAPGRPGKTIGSSAFRWLYLQSARNSGRLPAPPAGWAFVALYLATCAFQAAWSMGIQPGAETFCLAVAGGLAEAGAETELDGDGPAGGVLDGAGKGWPALAVCGC